MESDGDLESHLRERLASGSKLLVPYLTCGLPTPQGFLDLIAQLAPLADAIEIGIPFSDPVMDGPVIQESSQRALDAGMTLARCLDLILQARAAGSVPQAVMTYFNLVHHRGLQLFVSEAYEAGVTGLIVPDLPYEESSGLDRVCEPVGMAHVQLVAPSSSERRAAMIAAASRGFVYAVSRLGVTGERHSLASAAATVVSRIRPHTSLPILLGVGISSPELAREGCLVADGVIVGTALVRRVLEHDLEGAVSLIKEMREAI
jgi:tryptophan synthase alpha chain